MSKPSVQLVLALADLVLDALDAYVLEVNLLRVVALDLLLELYQVVQLELVLLLEVVLHSNLLRLAFCRLLLRLLLELAVEGGKFWDFVGLLPDGLEEFSAIESHCGSYYGFLFFFVWAVGEVLDPKAVFLSRRVEVGSGIHGRFGIAAGRTVIEVVGLPEGFLGELFLGYLFGKLVVLVVN